MISTLNKQNQTNNKKTATIKQQKLIQAPAQYVTLTRTHLYPQQINIKN